MASDLVHVTLRNLKRLVSALHPNGQQGSCCFGAAEHPLSGKQAHTYAIELPDTVQWAIRVPVHGNHLEPDALSSLVETEVNTLRTLQDAGFAWSPKLVAFDSSFDNSIQFPYVILSWIPGRPMQWSETAPAERKDRSRIICQVMNMTVVLANATYSGSVTNGYRYLVDMIDRQICRAINGQLPGASVQDCLIHRVLARMAVDPNADSRAFMISHDDLASGNIIVDDEYNIQGVIDWGFARKLPLQFGLGYPRFLSIEPPTDLNEPPPACIREFISEYFRVSAVLQEDRKYCISYLSSRSDSMSQRMYSFLAVTDVDWRRHIFDAATSKGLHEWMAGRSWLHVASEKEWDRLRKAAMGEEVKSFVNGNVARRMGIDLKSLETSLNYALST